ncbi:GvpL/GvpF family gas vesicle protein [Nocardioides sp. CER19]|uniref:GvpL/GvpF family gas vesicle protein n=1 Tax=Nocardioides sp. CER19 TaxID=3038538 RepID=UPI0024476F8A|nr:GvpL/GvpF family gas vesicle protein [Nocardioides sp. CER19]MDH2415874.1 GvpL/GvpF family gas vesicle protein [Nocardioides sp. CER19]
MSTGTQAPTPLPLPGAGTDTGWFVYGITSRSVSVPESIRGVDDQPVHLLTYGELAAVASAALLDRPPGRRAEILAYTTVLDTLAEESPVAPVRFGSIFADDQDVVDHLLAPSTDDLATLLADLQGRTQLRLTATYRQEVLLAGLVADDPDIARLRDLTRDAPEEAYHAERVQLGQLVAQAVERIREGDAQELLDTVAPLCVGVAEQPARGLDGLLDAALLVDRSRVETLEDVLEVVAETVHERIELRLVGPMAPYDFVEGEAWG